MFLMFQPNDKVICMDAEPGSAFNAEWWPLTKDSIYTIDYVSGYFCYLKETGMRGFRIDRFELIEKVDEPVSLWDKVRSWWVS